mgnify:CR=1 FL=1
MGSPVTFPWESGGSVNHSLACHAGVHEYKSPKTLPLGVLSIPGAFAPDRSAQVLGYRGGLNDEEGAELEKHTFRRSQLTAGTE